MRPDETRLDLAPVRGDPSGETDGDGGWLLPVLALVLEVTALVAVVTAALAGPFIPLVALALTLAAAGVGCAALSARRDDEW